ncbi:MAG TPA: tRNA-dihydrouridine synthase family protein, partial [Candidatus Paceibacterota bacterium]
MKKFWEKLPKPFFCLAPMADVTDAAFRRVIAKYGKPDVMWTEFVSADGLSSPGREVLKNNLIFSKKEKPIIAQLFSSHPIKMRQAAKYVASLGFDGIDINMGCPDRSIEKQGAGAAMMKDMKKAGEIIQAV